MVSLNDRLDSIVGGKAAGALEEVLGIRTIDDLLRHYPRTYSHGTTVLDEDDEPPAEGSTSRSSGTSRWPTCAGATGHRAGSTSWSH